jgi:hypothetical protein
MKPLALLATALALLNATAPAWGEGTNPGDVGVNPGAASAEDGPNIVDHVEPWNNYCSTSEPWRGLTRDSSVGHVGGPADRYDWSSVWLYRTESLTPSITRGPAVAQFALDCAQPPATGTLFGAPQDAAYYLRASSPTNNHASYTLHYEITPNDANTGADVSNTAQGAYPINVLASTDATSHYYVSGALPNRADQPLGPDADWYKINPGLPYANPPRKECVGLDWQACLDLSRWVPRWTPLDSVSLGLLTVTFTPDCDTSSTFQFALLENDAQTQIGHPQVGCGTMKQACIALSFSPASGVFAKAEVVHPSPGGGYDFSADLSPLYIINPNDGQVTLPSLDQPWCNPLVPLALSETNPGASVVDKAGNVLAQIPTAGGIS